MTYINPTKQYKYSKAMQSIKYKKIVSEKDHSRGNDR